MLDKNLKIAIVHDHFAQRGGAEKVVEVLAKMFPKAPLYFLLYKKENVDEFFKGRKIESSIIQKMPGGVKHYQWYMPFMPMAVEFFDLRPFDIVVSSTSSFAKGVICSDNTLHICYCHTATRYLWSDTHQYINELRYNKYFKKVIAFCLNYIRIWDRTAGDRPDVYITNSKTSRKRIRRYYKRDAKIVYPSFEDVFYLSDKKEDYYLAGCRMVPYKRLDSVVEAFLKMPEKKLKIFGDGTDEKRLKELAGDAKNIEFLGRVSEEKKRELYSKAKAFINPQKEDFGITPVEAMASGTPVIALKYGGSLENNVEGKTGIFIKKAEKDDIIEAVDKIENINWNKKEIREHAMQFSEERFKKEMFEFVEREWEKFNS